MSFMAKIAAGAATLALAGGGLGMVGTLRASAATPSCAAGCDSWYAQKFAAVPAAYVLDVLHGQASTGNGVILFRASNSNPAEDFVTDYNLGTVDSYYSHHRHLISAGFDHAYGGDDVIEIRYEPLGRPTNFCISTWPGEPARAGFKIRLESCRQTGSLFIKDAADKRGGYVPLITGTDTNYRDPLVLNYPAGNPADMPRPWLNVEPLSTYRDHPATVYDSQMWKAKMGVLP
jgi:hypothetical protein